MSAIAAGIIGGVGAIGGALISGSAAQNAANTESQAATSANQLSYTEWQQEQANMAPYLQSGQQGLAALNAAMPSLTSQFTAADFQSNPGYQFQLQQGLLGAQRSAAAGGMLNSVGTQETLNNYAQGAANTDYQQALTNFTNSQQQRYNMLSGVANMGLSATGMSNSAGQNYANTSSQNLMGAANASAAGQIATGNAAQSGLNSTANGLMNYNLMGNLISNQQSLGMGNTPQNFQNGAYLTGGGTTQLPAVGQADPSLIGSLVG